VARDNDPAGDKAMTVLIERASAVGIETIVLTPRLGDFNEDLRLLGFDVLAAHLRLQVASIDIARFMSLAA
ncbi:MAG: toprim domain-containing protein, partial [Hyphomicrobiales bacterium]|nr:toprim domain-containing protein [Hyphomicrobiales bacterium]